MEINILNFINDNLHGSGFINQLFKIITILSDKGIIWIALGLFLLIFKKTRKAGLVTIVGVLSTLFVNTLILKNIFDRTRPFIESPALATFIESIGLALPDDSSFPSGHTFVSFCCSIILCLQLGKKWAYVYIFAGITAFSRIFLCVHYPTDVLAGMAFGTAVGIGIHFLMKFSFKKLEPYILKFKEARLKKQTQNSLETNSQNSDTETEE